MIDGPIAPLGDADQLRDLIAHDAAHRALYRVFLAVRDAAAEILENTTISDLIVGSPRPQPSKPRRRVEAIGKKMNAGVAG
jgi:hypothetical protein